MGSRAPLATDNFPGVTLSGSYSVISDAGSGFTVASNKVTGILVNSDNMAKRNDISPINDQYSEVKVETIVSSSKEVQPFVQGQGTSAVGSLCFYSVWTGGPGDCEIWKRINNTETDLQAITSNEPDVGDKISLEVVSDTITAFKNTTAIGTPQAGGSSLSGGLPGIGIYDQAVLSTAEFGNVIGFPPVPGRVSSLPTLLVM